MRIISKVAAIALMLSALFPALAASAQTCDDDVYVCSNSPDNGGSDTGGGGSVEPTETTLAADGNEATDDGPANTAKAPSGALPITGGDVVGMATIGFVAIALGAVLVRRSRTAKQQAA